jgi:hypothetical protein
MRSEVCHNAFNHVASLTARCLLLSAVTPDNSNAHQPTHLVDNATCAGHVVPVCSFRTEKLMGRKTMKQATSALSLSSAASMPLQQLGSNASQVSLLPARSPGSAQHTQVLQQLLQKQMQSR